MLHSVRVQNPEGDLILQQDNHPVHCSMGVQRWFTRRPEIKLIPWPHKSPYLNVVEHMWAKQKEGRILRYGNNPPPNPQQLRDQVVEIWDNLAQDHDYCLTLANSIPRRCGISNASTRVLFNCKEEILSNDLTNGVQRKCFTHMCHLLFQVQSYICIYA